MKTQNKEQDKKKCVICGARIRRKVGADTCDRICTRALISGRSRGRQITYEIVQAMRDWEGTSLNGKSEFAYVEGNNYNQPYLLDAAA